MKNLFPTKILVATPLFPPEIGGPATYAKILSEELPKRGIETEILVFREVRSLPKIVRHFAYFLRCIGKGRDCGLIYALDPVSVGFPAWLAAKLTGKRFVLKVAGDFAWEMYNQRPTTNDQRPDTLEKFQKRKYDWLTEIRRFVERFVASKAEKVIVPSEYLKKIILMWGVPAEKIKVIYNAFSPPRLLFDKETARQALKIGGDEKIIISAGRLVPWKGFGALIESFSGVLRQFPNSRLFIAGDGPDASSLKLKSKNEKLEENVVFLGQLKQAELHRYIVATDAFVLNTGYEGLSHLLLEVMALGTPIITTAVGGNPEVLKGGQSAIFVAYNDKVALTGVILEILSNPEKANTLVAEAKKSLAKFTLETMITSTISVLKKTYVE